ncbi:hypothetical protein MNBD_BACTEROID03-286 [hydrothermal vent metagenome]|uniref:Uncharacterized protein n=1 Tax=hydrothermal vent metagenome TaxID=652676 RepID=A0A3B0TD92_9ZZZZ
MTKNKFKLPRKKKKFLKKGIWLYPADKNGSSLAAWPATDEKDFLAFKKGLLRKLFQRNKKRSKEYFATLDKEITVSDETLRMYVNDIFAKNYRQSAYDTLREAKMKKSTIKPYYHFINAYHLHQEDEDSYSNACCMSVDFAKKLIRDSKKK